MRLQIGQFSRQSVMNISHFITVSYTTFSPWHVTCFLDNMKQVQTKQLNRNWVKCCAILCLSAVPVFALAQEPELKLVKVDKPISVGEKYRIDCEVAWQGDAAEFAVLAAEIDPVDWGTAELVESRATVRDGQNVVAQSIDLIPEKPGDFETPEIRIAYLRPKESKPPEDPSSRTNPNTRSAYPPLRVAPFTLHVDPGRAHPRAFGGLLGALSLFLVAMVALWWNIRRRQPRLQPAASGIPHPDPDVAEAAIESASRLRLNGDHYRFYQELLSAVVPLGEDATELKSKFEKRMADAGYRGVRPTDEDMDGDIRELRRAWAVIKNREDA
jgi:hypothetical protein